MIGSKVLRATSLGNGQYEKNEKVSLKPQIYVQQKLFKISLRSLVIAHV
jgi:hypothetical protein